MTDDQIIALGNAIRKCPSQGTYFDALHDSAVTRDDIEIMFNELADRVEEALRNIKKEDGEK